MSSDKKFSLLRNILRALGLSESASEDVVNWIIDLLAGDGNTEEPTSQFPYRLNEHFLTPAELRFFQALQAATNGNALLCPKVSLGDLFRVEASDQSRYRIYTNKIDRKHVDFLLCDPSTLRPLVAIELDDKSHQRADRRARDAFVDEVFRAAHLPIIHVPVRATYKVADLTAKIAPYVACKPAPPVPRVSLLKAPPCPQCGSEMVFRIDRKGTSLGQHFWVCSNYPDCRAMLPFLT